MKIIHDTTFVRFFATTFLSFIIDSEKRWRRKQHYQINHIKNISSSNYISIRMIQNITHKVDIKEKRKNRNKKITSFFFCLFLLTLCKAQFIQLSIYKVLTAMDRKRKLIYRSKIVCTLLRTKQWYYDDSSFSSNIKFPVQGNHISIITISFIAMMYVKGKETSRTKWW